MEEGEYCEYSDMAAQFPWDQVKAETLRSLCKDLGLSSRQRGKREYMVRFLEETEKAGLDAALEYAEKNAPPEPEKRVDVNSTRRSKRSREVEPMTMESVGKRRRQEPAAGRPPARRAAANGKKVPAPAAVPKAKRAQPSPGAQTKARRRRPRKQKAQEQDEPEAEAEAEAPPAEPSSVVSEHGVTSNDEWDANDDAEQASSVIAETPVGRYRIVAWAGGRVEWLRVDN